MHSQDIVKSASIMISDEIMDIYERYLYESNALLKVLCFMIKHKIQSNRDYYMTLYKENLYRIRMVENMFIDLAYKQLHILPMNITDLVAKYQDGVILVMYYE